MKATGMFVVSSFSILFFFTWIAGGQLRLPVDTAPHTGSQALELAEVRHARPEQARRSVNRPAPFKRWLEGNWEGTAYQSNTKENWTLKLRVKTALTV
jgi:hypothetical protein